MAAGRERSVSKPYRNRVVWIGGGEVAYKGYLIKFGSTPFPEDCLTSPGYTCTPKNRHNWKKYRDNNATTHVDNAASTKASIVIETKEYLSTEKNARIQAALQDGLLNEIEQRYKVEFWDPSINDYRTAEMRLVEPIEYVVLDTWDSGPVYDALSIELEEF